jgi:hypothetical protein
MGLIEIVVAAIQIAPMRTEVKLLPVICLSWCFILYHVAGVALGIQNPCPCMGRLTLVPLLETHGRSISFGFAVFMLILSIFGCQNVRRLESSTSAAPI